MATIGLVTGGSMSSSFDVKEAAERLRAALPAENEILRYEVLWPILEVVDPRVANDPDARLEAMRRKKELFFHVLEFWEVDLLTNVQGTGYLRIPAADQAENALDKGARDARSALHKAAKRAKFVNSSGFTDAERRELSDARARLDKMARGLNMRERKW